MTSRQKPTPETVPVKLGFGSLNDAGEMIRTSPQTVRRMIARGVIRGYRVPGTKAVRVDLDELQAAMLHIPSAGDS